MKKIFSKAKPQINTELKKEKKFFTPINIIYTSIIFILVVSLVCTLFTIKNKNDYILSAKAQISENLEQIKQAEKKIKDYEAEIVEKNQVNSETSAALEEAKNQKSQLEAEVERLKTEIQNLSAKKSQPSTAGQYATTVTVSPEAYKVCYLTFDDGPSANTLKILDILNRYGVKATFFVINTNNIQYVKNIHEAGHAVGLHAYSHQYSEIYASEDAYFADLEKISSVVEGIIGIRPSIIRFPGGSSNAVSRKYCPGLMTQLVNSVRERGYQFFDWNVSSNDATSVTPSYTYIRNSVLNGAKNITSACVLMHDSSAKTTTVQALPEMIEGLIKMGYRFETLQVDTFGYHHGTLNN